MTTSGSVKNYVEPGSHVLGADAITRGPDGALWFVDRAVFAIGRITTSGTITRLHDVSVSGVNAVGITAGPDGGMWFTEALRFGSFTDAIGRTTGTVPSPPRNPGALPSGSPGRIGGVAGSGEQRRFADHRLHDHAVQPDAAGSTAHVQLAGDVAHPHGPEQGRRVPLQDHGHQRVRLELLVAEHGWGRNRYAAQRRPSRR